MKLLLIGIEATLLRTYSAWRLSATVLMVMHLDQLTKKQALELNVGTEAPIVYELDSEGKVESKQIL